MSTWDSGHMWETAERHHIASPGFRFNSRVWRVGSQESSVYRHDRHTVVRSVEVNKSMLNPTVASLQLSGSYYNLKKEHLNFIQIWIDLIEYFMFMLWQGCRNIWSKTDMSIYRRCVLKLCLYFKVYCALCKSFTGMQRHLSGMVHFHILS